jgi:hypothetical protein
VAVENLIPEELRKMRTIRNMILGAVFCGLIAFVFGLMAPPIAGIFITVPVGVVVGAILGAGFARRTQPAGEPPHYLDDRK